MEAAAAASRAIADYQRITLKRQIDVVIIRASREPVCGDVVVYNRRVRIGRSRADNPVAAIKDVVPERIVPNVVREAGILRPNTDWTVGGRSPGSVESGVIERVALNEIKVLVVWTIGLIWVVTVAVLARDRHASVLSVVVINGKSQTGPGIVEQKIRAYS